jgi:hypothetical protein
MSKSGPVVTLKAKMWDTKCPSEGPKYPTSWGSPMLARPADAGLGMEDAGLGLEDAGLGLEAVAHAWFGEEVTGAGRLLFQLPAQLGDVDAQVVGLGAVGGAPHVLK